VAIIILLVILLVAAALFFFLRAAHLQKEVGLPPGKVVYVDTRGQERVEKPLYDPQTHLTGKPDYVIRQGNAWIPVEVKSGDAPPQPYDSHVFQLAAYCLLVERNYGVRPSHGILRYRNRTFSIDYTPALEDELRTLLDEMHANRGEEERSHEHANRCAGCGFRNVCNEKL
jgi:CRISPR-associated exonuclease Cas4